MSKEVSVYDFVTKTITTLPAAELAPGMVEADIKGVGRYWINSAQAKDGDYKHAPFSEGIMDMIRKEIQIPLSEVRPLSLAHWEDGFRRDNDPAQEIAIWCRIADRFVQFSKSEKLNQAQRKECFVVMLNCTLVPEDKIFEVLTLDALTREQAIRAIEAFTKANG